MKRKVVIKGLPKNQSGAEVKMSSLRAGLGLNANVMPWPIMAGKMSEPDLKVNSTLQPVPREQANLEAEKDEVAMVPGQGNIPDTFTIGGKRHTQGGTPLNLPADSFIYSDTAKMRIKDPVILAQFGMPARKNGYTPAEIAKKYSTAPYKKILADHNVDPKQRETAELMLANYNLKLAKLALVQESMKGFPQGIPEVARPYIESMQINPEEFMQQNPGSPSNSEDSESQEGAMEIGGPVMQQQPGAPLQYLEEGGPDYFAMGGLTKYQTAGAVQPNTYKADPALSNIVNYLREKENADVKKNQYNKIYKQALAQGYAKWEQDKEAKENAERQASSARSHDYALKNELKRRENIIKNLSYEVQTGKDASSPIGYPANSGAENKLKKALSEYEMYLNKINKISPAFNEKPTDVPVNTVLQAGAPSGTVQPAGTPPAVSTATQTFEEAMKQYDTPKSKKFGGSTKKIKITNLPGMAYGGGLNKYQFAGENPYDPLNLFNQKLKMNTAQAAPQAQAVDYSLNAGIPANSPLNKQAMQLDFSSSKPVESNTALEAKQATEASEASETNRPYKTGRITQKTKTKYDPYMQHMALETGKNLATSLITSARTPYLKEQAHIKSIADYEFTPVEGGKKGTWVGSGMAYGLIDPNSPIVQQSGVAKYGGSMNQYKWGGLQTEPDGRTYAQNNNGPKTYVTAAQLAQLVAAENAQSASAKPATTNTSAPKKAATAPASSTIGVYNKEWTKYLTDLAKSSGMSIDDPRFKAKLPSYFFDEGTGKLKSQAELEKLTKTQSTQSALASGAFGEDYWNDAYKPDFIRRHKKLIDKFETEHPGESFDPTKKDINGGTQSSHLKWFQDAYNKEAKEKGAPTYDFGAPNKLGRLTYSAPSLEDFEEPATKKPEVTADAGPGITPVDNKTTDPLKVTHLDQKPISTPKYGWTARDMLNVTGAVGELMRTKKYMPWEATPGYHAADFVFDDPSRRIAAINETRNIAAQNMAGLTNSQAYAANFLAMNNLGDVANAISDVHSRNIGTANQKAMADAQYLNQVGQDKAAQQTRLWDKNQAVNQAYDAEQAAKRDVVRNMVGQGMSNASKIYNLNQLQPQFAINPFSETMYHKDPRSLKPKYAEKKDLAKEYQDVLTNNKNLNATPEGRKMAFDIAKYNVGVGPVTEEDAYMEYQKKRNASQIPQYGDNTEQQ